MILAWIDDEPLFPEPLPENERAGECTVGCYLEKREPHPFWCRDCDCEKKFLFFGIPTVCVWCGSDNIYSGIAVIDNLIKEVQDASPSALRERG